METIRHILRSLLNTPANESMKYDFKVPKKTHKYPQIPRTTLPMSIDKDIKQAVKKIIPLHYYLLSTSYIYELLIYQQKTLNI